MLIGIFWKSSDLRFMAKVESRDWERVENLPETEFFCDFLCDLILKPELLTTARWNF